MQENSVCQLKACMVTTLIALTAMWALLDRVVMTKTMCYYGSAEVALVFSIPTVENVNAALV
jgi:hypothetical protein